VSEVELRDAILRHSLQLLRLSAHDEAEVEAILTPVLRDGAGQWIIDHARLRFAAWRPQ